MPTPITPVATWTGTIPTPDDGEGATGAGLDAPLQALADREEYLKSQVDSVGVRRLRTFSSMAALIASTPSGTGDIAYVIGYGVYRYDSAGVGPSDPPWKLLHGAGGDWTHELKDVAAAYLATLSAGKVVQPTPYQTLDAKVWRYSGTSAIQTVTAPSAVWTKVTLSALAFTGVATTDIIELDSDFELQSAGANTVQMAIGLDDGGPTIFGETIRTIGSTKTRFPMHTLRNPTANGAMTVALFLKPVGADDVTIYGPGCLRAKVVRP